MAVPKKKRSHSRTANRRSQHKIAAPMLGICTRCEQRRRPHRVCRACGTYANREICQAEPHIHDHA